MKRPWPIMFWIWAVRAIDDVEANTSKPLMAEAYMKAIRAAQPAPLSLIPPFR